MKIKFVRNNENAITPSRANPRDIGMDLVCIERYKTLSNGVILYDTGISVCPPEGYYIEIVPRSSISKTGWILANSIGIIDPNYTKNLLVALTRIDSDAKEMELPFCVSQIVLRKAEYADMDEVERLDEIMSWRVGFGSTGARIN